MRTSRFTLAAIGLVLAVVVLAGCASSSRRSTQGTLPPDLPGDPEACTTYCRVWVPPVYRKVPRLVLVKQPCRVSEPETICRTRFQEICVKPRENKRCKTANWQCEQAVVQTRPGGYKWKKKPGVDCWEYCYEEPCYQWCSKTVTEEGIEYCTEVPPEYRTVAWTEPVEVCRERCIPGEYKVVWENEVYSPGHWEWKATKSCSCDCPSPCPTIPYKKRDSCVAEGLPRTN